MPVLLALVLLLVAVQADHLTPPGAHGGPVGTTERVTAAPR